MTITPFLLSVLAIAGFSAPNPQNPTSPISAFERSASARLGVTRLSAQRLWLPSAPETTSLVMDLDGDRVTMRLRRASMRSPDFQVLVQGADGALTAVAAPEPVTYRGTVDERPGTFVTGTIRDGRLTAVVALPGDHVFYVEPLPMADGNADPALHAVYRGDAVVQGDESCAADEPSVTTSAPREGRLDAQAVGTLKLADVAFDADYEFFQQNKSRVDSTVRDIESVLAGVNAIYQRDCGITHRVSTIVVRSTPSDPFTSASPETLLTQLKNDWNTNRSSVNRDMVHLMTGRAIAGNTIGYAGVGVVCNTRSAYGLSRSRYTTNYARRTALTAHELGHNWNASHCNGVVPCNIMCSTIAGCDGLGLPNFEPQGKTAITNYAASRTCLGTVSLGVDGLVPVASAAAGIQLETPWPSPVSGSTSIRYYLDRTGPTVLDVMDLAGRRVARIADGIQEQGWHTVTWNARDTRDRRVAPGTLFLRLGAGSTTRTRMITLIR